MSLLTRARPWQTRIESLSLALGSRASRALAASPMVGGRSWSSSGPAALADDARHDESRASLSILGFTSTTVATVVFSEPSMRSRHRQFPGGRW